VTRSPVLLGIDLGTRRCAGVACPTDWDGEWRRVRSIVVGEPLRRDSTDAERARRTETIAMQLVRFARETEASVALIESYAFGKSTAAHTLGELGGVVRLELVRAGLEVRTVQMSSARKLLLGKVPKADPGIACYAALRAAGARFDTADEAAAFTVANVEMADLGGHCFAQKGA
jgi:Holliday junction resolvasome RuvABC endonuclease subunit